MTAGRVVRALWVSVSLFVLFVALARSEADRPGDMVVVVLYAMLALSFPASLLVAGGFAGLVALQEWTGLALLDRITSERLGILLVWFGFFAAGYAQWFWLLPRLVRKFSRSRAPRATVR